jgi:hypothetical protein
MPFPFYFLQNFVFSLIYFPLSGALSFAVTKNILQSVARVCATQVAIDVVDPLMGAGTIGVVAPAFGCRFVGFDKEATCKNSFRILLRKTREKRTTKTKKSSGVEQRLWRPSHAPTEKVRTCLEQQKP